MATSSGTRYRNRQQLKHLLRELFQFDAADLDFGIYRILNARRDEIDRFIEKDLLDAVEEGLAHLMVGEREEFETRLAQLRDQLGTGAFDDSGAVRANYRMMPIAQEYTRVRQQLRSLDVAEETEARIFNDLVTFFSRYYDNGDFLTERRYTSRDAKYFVPYNGEEVLLHWANKDQYYVKSSERHADYRFTVGDYTIWFRLRSAQEAQDNVKTGKRCFVTSPEEPLDHDLATRTLTVNFEYRPLTEDEEAGYLRLFNDQQSKSNRRKTLDRPALCVALEANLLEGLKDQRDLRARLAAVPTGSDKSLLARHLNRYTARNTMDYFVHKDLGGFLRRELDFFLKNELLHLDAVVSDDSGEVLGHVVTRMRVVREIGLRIVDFLAQIEDFQKRLFEKRKFVVQTDYSVTLDRVPRELYPEIQANQAQLEEWRKLYNVDAWEKDLLWQGKFDEAFLTNHPYAMIDTAFFDADFKARLLAGFEDLELSTDGLLMHGENFQALNLLLGGYENEVQCVYIDPPYNTGNDDGFAYKDDYQHSSWLSMMHDRLQVGFKVLSNDGVVFVSIDDREKQRLSQLMDSVLGPQSAIATFVRKRRIPSGMSQNMVSQDHEYVVSYSRAGATPFRGLNKDYARYSNPDNDPRGDWVSDNLTVGMNNEQRPNQFYDLVDPRTGKAYPADPNRVWAYAPETMRQKIAENLIIFPKDTSRRPTLKRFRNDLKVATNPISTWIDNKPGESDNGVTSLKAGLNLEGTRQIQSVFGRNVFTYTKPVSLISELIGQIAVMDETVLDFFAGSGTTAHAVMNLNREDGGNRKYILVEMGDYFDTVLKPRIQKVAFSAKWKDGVPQDRDGMSHMFKYQRIESYEDALNNIRVNKPAEGQLKLLETFDDYMLHYMLDFETSDSPSLLQPKAFETPFEYKLKIQRGHESPQWESVDLVETFHYLIGLQVRKLEHLRHQERTYVISRGE
ncbi:MAG: site-specific DNA-methyltransferase, partial [Anaerolineae bacterium]|nr:site-specific DNA-methyltransferase [Anaerolineae bacterium]